MDAGDVFLLIGVGVVVYLIANNNTPQAPPQFPPAPPGYAYVTNPATGQSTLVSLQLAQPKTYLVAKTMMPQRGGLF